MASRTVNIASKILAGLLEWDTPATVTEIANEFDLEPMAAFNILQDLEEKGKVTGEGRGLTSTWTAGKAPTDIPQQEVKPKRKRRTKAEMEAARAEERARLEYNTRAAESQDMVMSQATVIPAETPVIASDGEPVTVPVDYDNPSAGRRELDASKGERVLGETTFKRRDPLAEMEAMIARVRARVTDKMTDEMVNEIVRQEKAGVFEEILFPPTNPECPGNVIPPLPEGIHPHTWELAHDGNTEASRKYYRERAEAEREAFLKAREIAEDIPPF